jgi:methylmalonyl-CoA mutase C-terminal domain/subunit
MEKIRVLMAVLGLDQHEVGAISVSRALRDAGMEVIYLGRFNLPPKILKTALEEDVDIIGLSCHSWEFLYYISDLVQLLKDHNAKIPIIVGGSLLTHKDIKLLLEKGVAAAFGASTPAEEIIRHIKSIVENQ